ncbi:MAG TPA: hypothetical protein VIX84_04325 [Acidimicrobiales bacterium]
MAEPGDTKDVDPVPSESPTRPLSRADMARRLGTPSGRPPASATCTTAAVLPRPTARIDSDFTAITIMATGAFSTQTKEFFNSNIRTALEKALAESRGQIRYLEVQQEHQAAGTASIYAVVDQGYVNNKISTPQADVVRLTADLQQAGGV